MTYLPVIESPQTNDQYRLITDMNIVTVSVKIQVKSSQLLLESKICILLEGSAVVVGRL
jgi:hypothetical protein